MKNIIIVGGGLAGLVASILLARKGIKVTLIEKKTYPFHRVCGEYISNETLPFLLSQNLFPKEFKLPVISTFQLSSAAGKSSMLALDLGGFGISRFSFDHFLYEEAKKSGVNFLLNDEVTSILFDEDEFHVQSNNKTLTADLVLCAFGKRSKLDLEFKRNFVNKRSPYVGVKYHIKTDHPDHLIALHNFEGGYCGISNIEGSKTNLCYLVHREKLRQSGSIENLEKKVLKKNPLLRDIFENSDFLFDKPETINEISFETKEPVFNHLLMLGDAAGMITPLCGNGMAMAIRSAKLAAELIADFCNNSITRRQLEKKYTAIWKKEFASHLWFGRQVQKLFGNEFVSNIAVNLPIHSKFIANQIVKNTHGNPF
ncbi:MAG: NAD(P)/FAD-dependent oxidoreductase [Bacteroidetes bacterium]|nr:NAD(P)/FAD-dependent oxidoreductase [Bacteroidota bacterium]